MNDSHADIKDALTYLHELREQRKSRMGVNGRPSNRTVWLGSCPTTGEVMQLQKEKERARQRLHTTLSIVIQRQREVASLARDTKKDRGTYDFSLVCREAHLTNVERDAIFAAAVDRLRLHGFETSDASLPAPLQDWLHSTTGQDFLGEQASILDGLEWPTASAAEMAWAVRVVQLQNREMVPRILQKAVGADELTPMMEQVVLAFGPTRAWSAAARMNELPDELLLTQANLAAAIDGWTVAVQGVQNAAIKSWRRTMIEAELWKVLSRLPLAQLLPDARDFEVPLEELQSVRTLLSMATEEEAKVWVGEVAGDYAQQLRHAVSQLVRTALAVSDERPTLSSRLSSCIVSPRLKGSSSVGSMQLGLRLWAHHTFALIFCCA